MAVETSIQRNTRLYNEKVAQLDALNATIAQAYENGAIEQSTFDTGTYGARQHVKTTNLDSLLKQAATLESQIARLARIINGSGLYRQRFSRM